jgi:hypothetical protein
VRGAQVSVSSLQSVAYPEIVIALWLAFAILSSCFCGCWIPLRILTLAGDRDSGGLAGGIYVDIGVTSIVSHVEVLANEVMASENGELEPFERYSLLNLKLLCKLIHRGSWHDCHTVRTRHEHIAQPTVAELDDNEKQYVHGGFRDSG